MKILLVFLFSAIYINLVAQNCADYTYHSYKPILATYNCIARDNKGNVYFGTDKGLVAYKNNSWYIFNSKNSYLPFNDINSIYPDRFDTTLWIGTDSGLIHFQYTNTIKPVNYFYHHSISGVKMSNDTTLYFKYDQRWVAFKNGKLFSFIITPRDTDISHGYTLSHYTDTAKNIEVDSQGQIYTYNVTGAFRYNHNIWYYVLQTVTHEDCCIYGIQAGSSNYVLIYDYINAKYCLLYRNYPIPYNTFTNLQDRKGLKIPAIDSTWNLSFWGDCNYDVVFPSRIFLGGLEKFFCMWDTGTHRINAHLMSSGCNQYTDSVGFPIKKITDGTFDTAHNFWAIDSNKIIEFEYYKNSLVNNFKNDINQGFKLYPNPLIDRAQIISPHSNSLCHLAIYDIVGNILRENNFESAKPFLLERKNLTPGIYLLQIKSMSTTWQTKLVVE